MFFKKCWSIIKHDVVAAANALYNNRCADLNLLNKATIILIPKKEGADTVHDFRPISLIHAFAKIITKVLALRLAPFMNRLTSQCQSAFIKGRNIHDNFMFVRNLTRRLHRSRSPTLLMKLDISKAFDSVRWDYLLTLLQKRGFPSRWMNWIASILATSTSRVLLNGIPLDPISHGRGLRQGDPLSPLLFVLAIDPLPRLLSVATELGLLNKIRGCAARFRASLYTDDAAIFIKPDKKDIKNLTHLLCNFGEASGLNTNLAKTSVSAICCEGIDLQALLTNLPIKRSNFPIKYLGLPLSPRRLRRVDFQPLIDKVAGKLSTWHGKNLTQAGRVTLTKSVLSVQLIYLLTALKPHKEVLEEIDRIRKRFLWAGDEHLTGGKCKVNWTRSCLPKEFGGLGILNLDNFSRALRLRWLWHDWVSPEKAWVGSDLPCDSSDRLLFAACTTITLGDGKKTKFWLSAWLHGRRPKDIAPNLYNLSRNKQWTVAEALQTNNWVRQIRNAHSLCTTHLAEFVQLWGLVQEVPLRNDQADDIKWKFSPAGVYSAKSAYKAQFLGSTAVPALSSIWKTWAPPKCKFFAWLIFQNRVWTADRLASRGWPHNTSCALCRQTMESALHLLAECRFTRRIWNT